LRTCSNMIMVNLIQSVFINHLHTMNVNIEIKTPMVYLCVNPSGIAGLYPALTG